MEFVMILVVCVYLCIFLICFMTVYYINFYTRSNKNSEDKNFVPYEVKSKRNLDYKVYNVPILRESKSNTIVVPDEVSENESSTRSTQEEECKVYKKPVNMNSEKIERNLNNEKSTKNVINNSKEDNNSETRNKNNESNTSNIKNRNDDFEDGPIKENNGILSELFGNKPDEL